MTYVQTTSPLVRPDFLNEACQKIFDGWDAVFSVQRLHKFTWKETTGGDLKTQLLTVFLRLSYKEAAKSKLVVLLFARIVLAFQTFRFICFYKN